MADYTSSTDVRELLTDSNFTTDTSYDTLLGTLITAASRLIDRYVGGGDNYFLCGSDEQTRYYDGSASRELWIDSMVSLTSVAVSENGGVSSSDYTSWTLDTDYVVSPYNYVALGKPITQLIVRWDSSKGHWTRFPKAVKVTGVFGYSTAVPEDVVMAVKIQVMRWFMRAKGGFEDTAAAASVGQMFYTQELDPDIKLILQHYRVIVTAV
jgi:hypothetical protein